MDRLNRQNVLQIEGGQNEVLDSHPLSDQETAGSRSSSVGPTDSFSSLPQTPGLEEPTVRVPLTGLEKVEADTKSKISELEVQVGILTKEIESQSKTTNSFKSALEKYKAITGNKLGVIQRIFSRDKLRLEKSEVKNWNSLVDKLRKSRKNNLFTNKSEREHASAALPEEWKTSLGLLREGQEVTHTWVLEQMVAHKESVLSDLEDDLRATNEELNHQQMRRDSFIPAAKTRLKLLNENSVKSEQSPLEGDNSARQQEIVTRLELLNKKWNNLSFLTQDFSQGSFQTFDTQNSLGIQKQTEKTKENIESAQKDLRQAELLLKFEADELPKLNKYSLDFKTQSVTQETSLQELRGIDTVSHAEHARIEAKLKQMISENAQILNAREQLKNKLLEQMDSALPKEASLTRDPELRSFVISYRASIDELVSRESEVNNSEFEKLKTEFDKGLPAVLGKVRAKALVGPISGPDWQPNAQEQFAINKAIRDGSDEFLKSFGELLCEKLGSNHSASRLLEKLGNRASSLGNWTETNNTQEDQSNAMMSRAFNVDINLAKVMRSFSDSKSNVLSGESKKEVETDREAFEEIVDGKRSVVPEKTLQDQVKDIEMELRKKLDSEVSEKARLYERIAALDGNLNRSNVEDKDLEKYRSQQKIVEGNLKTLRSELEVLTDLNDQLETVNSVKKPSAEDLVKILSEDVSSETTNQNLLLLRQAIVDQTRTKKSELDEQIRKLADQEDENRQRLEAKKVFVEARKQEGEQTRTQRSAERTRNNTIQDKVLVSAGRLQARAEMSARKKAEAIEVAQAKSDALNIYTVEGKRLLPSEPNQFSPADHVFIRELAEGLSQTDPSFGSAQILLGLEAQPIETGESGNFVASDGKKYEITKGQAEVLQCVFDSRIAYNSPAKGRLVTDSGAELLKLKFIHPEHKTFENSSEGVSSGVVPKIPVKEERRARGALESPAKKSEPAAEEIQAQMLRNSRV